ncbi:hypothetical protein V493_04399 [Pseudogymnoascus sp. VKM F-4281 (FW-2241)]|nr:hypothetical protein V493_04399 [Pseudogymnoascus sp. VKM F-4281 (FW-2241)]
MDDYMFREHVKNSRPVAEETSYLEIFSYSDPTLNSVKEEPLANDELENFLHRQGAFQPPILPAGITQVAGLRMILQQNASHPETFSPQYISLKQRAYVSMVETMRLPYRGIESTSAVGPFFWAAFDQDEERPHLQILFRKSDVRKKGLTRGWELMLSHDLRGGMTMGYCKGTPSSDIVECVRHLKACSLQIGHPMLLPTIIFSHDMSSKTDIKQREARDWLRKLEHAVSMRQEIDDKESYVDQDGLVDFDLINRHLVECHSQVLWKRPKAYTQILQSFEEAMELFKSAAESGERWQGELKKLNASMLSRHEFYRKKLQGIDSYAYTTLQRLAIQRSALYNIIAQRESKLNFQMAGEQRKLAHASKRDSGAQKTIALLGALFLPGAFLASMFSMSFFNFQNGVVDSNPEGPIVSGSFWIYWAVTIPLTLFIVGMWHYWERRKERRYLEEDLLLEKGVESMEIQIQAQMRRRTMSKVATWDTKAA